MQGQKGAQDCFSAVVGFSDPGGTAVTLRCSHTSLFVALLSLFYSSIDFFDSSTLGPREDKEQRCDYKQYGCNPVSSFSK